MKNFQGKKRNRVNSYQLLYDVKGTFFNVFHFYWERYIQNTDKEPWWLELFRALNYILIFDWLFILTFRARFDHSGLLLVHVARRAAMLY